MPGKRNWLKKITRWIFDAPNERTSKKERSIKSEAKQQEKEIKTRALMMIAKLNPKNYCKRHGKDLSISGKQRGMKQNNLLKKNS